MELIKTDQISISKKALNELAVRNAERDLETNDAIEVYTFMKKLTDYANEYMGVVKDKALAYLTGNGKSVTLYGSEISIRNGYEILDYEKDPIYSELSQKLKERQELLKTARKSKLPIYDSEGVEVPRVPTKSITADSINYKY